MKKAGSLSLAAGAVAIGTMALAAPAMAAGPAASVTPNKGLVNGQAVKVKFSGYPKSSSGVTVVAIQCTKAIASQSDATKFCNIKGAKTLKTTTGAGTITGLKVVVGKVGTAGVCKSKGSCVIGVASIAPQAAKFVKITFK